MQKSTVLCIIAVLLQCTTATSSSVCDAIKSKYNDISCCGGNENTTAVCASRSIDAELSAIKKSSFGAVDNRVQPMAMRYADTYPLLMTSRVDSILIYHDNIPTVVEAIRPTKVRGGIDANGATFVNFTADGYDNRQFQFKNNSAIVEGTTQYKAQALYRTSTGFWSRDNECKDYNELTSQVFGGVKCEDIVSYCSQNVIVNSFCAKTCGSCDMFCENNEDAWSAWVTGNGWEKTTCNTAKFSTDTKLLINYFADQITINDAAFVAMCGHESAWSGKCLAMYDDGNRGGTTIVCSTPECVSYVQGITDDASYDNETLVALNVSQSTPGQQCKSDCVQFDTDILPWCCTGDDTNFNTCAVWAFCTPESLSVGNGDGYRRSIGRSSIPDTLPLLTRGVWVLPKLY